MGSMHRHFQIKKFSVHPITVLLWVWMFFVLGPLAATNYFFAIAIHEAGHYFVAKKLGYNLSKFSFSPYGVSLSYYNQTLENRDELKVALAGPIANFVSVLFMVALWWMFPNTYFFTESFVYISVLLALLNLLPAYPLDGGRIFICTTSNFFSEKVAKKITFALNLVLAFAFLILFCVFCFINFNPSYLLFAVFLIVGVLDLKESSKYEKINVFSKTSKNFSKPEFLIIDQEATLKELLQKIETNKTIVFCLILDNGKILNLSEKMILKMSLNFDLNKKIKEIIEK